ncbi:MAG: 4Fe-4S binding protein [Firmicutes bacterium]|jgi:ferredoxin|nr:4Fe-4S binding protein [Bacillota bacterium]HPU02141.1 4Fe-4S binding protein [Bacillota bacterium]
MAYKVNKDICIGCGACMDSCAEEAISMTEEDVAYIDPKKCARCGVCASLCPQEAIEEVDEEEVEE